MPRNEYEKSFDPYREPVRTLIVEPLFDQTEDDVLAVCLYGGRAIGEDPTKHSATFFIIARTRRSVNHAMTNIKNALKNDQLLGKEHPIDWLVVQDDEVTSYKELPYGQIEEGAWLYLKKTTQLHELLARIEKEAVKAWLRESFGMKNEKEVEKKTDEVLRIKHGLGSPRSESDVAFH